MGNSTCESSLDHADVQAQFYDHVYQKIAKGNPNNITPQQLVVCNRRVFYKKLLVVPERPIHVQVV